MEHTLENKAYTLDFLASSIEVQLPEAFTGYVRWLQTVLVTRNLDIEMVAESLADLQEVLKEFPDTYPVAEPYFKAAQSGLDRKPSSESALDDTRSAYLQAVLSADRRAAMTVVQDSLRISEPASVYADVVAPAMHEVGRLWQTIGLLLRESIWPRLPPSTS